MKVLASLVMVLVFDIFLVHGASRRCFNKKLDAMSGEIKSPGYPRFRYPNSANCWYTIRAKTGYIVEITFTHFELEPPRRAQKTDYVRIMDGPRMTRKQILDYDGTTVAPFTFVSMTNRVFIRFTTNKLNRRRGFHATYRQMRPPVYCNRLFLLDGTVTCQPVGSEGLYSHCDITCDVNYALEGNMTTHCNNGSYTNVPTCSVDPDLAEFCSKDIVNPGCPFPPEILAEYYLVHPPNRPTDMAMDADFTALFDNIGDGLAELEPASSIMAGRAGGNRYKCPSYLCDYVIALKRFRYNCRQLALALQQKYKLNDNTMKKRMIHCYSCQSGGCGPVSIFS